MDKCLEVENTLSLANKRMQYCCEYSCSRTVEGLTVKYFCQLRRKTWRQMALTVFGMPKPAGLVYRVNVQSDSSNSNGRSLSIDERIIGSESGTRLASGEKVGLCPFEPISLARRTYFCRLSLGYIRLHVNLPATGGPLLYHP